MTMYDLLKSKGFTVKVINPHYLTVSLNRKLKSDEVLMEIDYHQDWTERVVNGVVHLMTFEYAAEIGLWDDVEIME